jgi:magnesium-transporting ATPase (P-type)
MRIHKLLSIVALILAVIGIIFGLLVATGDLESLWEDGSMVDNMMRVAYVIFAITLLLVLFYVIKGLFTGNIKKTLLSLGVFFGIVIISYFMASGTNLDLQPFIDKGLNVTETTSKNVGAGLYTFYALAVFAIAVMAFSGLKKIVK